jgi:hypothetical protein
MAEAYGERTGIGRAMHAGRTVRAPDDAFRKARRFI